jgi:hypothetical protein
MFSRRTTRSRADRDDRCCVGCSTPGRLVRLRCCAHAARGIGACGAFEFLLQPSAWCGTGEGAHRRGVRVVVWSVVRSVTDHSRGFPFFASFATHVASTYVVGSSGVKIGKSVLVTNVNRVKRLSRRCANVPVCARAACSCGRESCVRGALIRDPVR